MGFRALSGIHRARHPRVFRLRPGPRVGRRARDLPGPLPGRHLVAAPWAPDPTLFDKGGTVRPEFVWAALDCPSSFALLEAFGGARRC